MKRIPRWARWVARIIFAPLGCILGFSITTNVLDNYFVTAVPPNSVFYALYAVLGAVVLGAICALIAPSICSAIYTRTVTESGSLKAYSPAEVISAFIGLLAGMFLAFLVVQLYSYINSKSQTVMAVLSVLTYLCLGLVGMIIGYTNLKEIIAPKSITTIHTPKVLDSSTLIDGRILDIVATGFLAGPFVISNFVIDELRTLSDNADVLKRNRGRRGLDTIKHLQANKQIEVIIDESRYEGDTDTRLILLAKEIKGNIVTVNYNLTKVASVKEVKTLNINDLSNAIKPIVLPGEKMTVEIVKEGKDAGQGVAYLPDGTMIVVENGESKIGQKVEIYITTSLQTSTGRIIFGRI